MTVDPEWAIFMVSWVSLTGLTRTLRETFFTAANSENQHIELLEHWKMQLAAWKDNHQSVDSEYPR
jgi:hypothetical protein